MTLSLRKKPRQQRDGKLFVATARRLIEREKWACSASTTRNRLTALRSFEQYLPDNDIDVHLITTQVIAEYDRWLENREVSKNTRSCYMRSLRSLYNKVAPQKAKTRRDAAFSKVFTGNAPTAKRSTDRATIRRIIQVSESLEGVEKLAADIFLFSFYAMGMPFADVARLRYSNIQEGYIVYHRRKTGNEVHIKLEPCMRKIIDRWRNQNGNLVFPLVAHDTPTCLADRRYLSALRRYNRTLKQVAKQAGISKNITSYVPRHTWATMANAKNLPRQLIAVALGHSNVRTSETYIKPQRNRVLSKVNNQIINWISGSAYPQ